MVARRRAVLAIGAATLAPLGVHAQQRRPIWRIGVLQLGSKEFFLQGGYQAAFEKGMRERGYVSGSDSS
jgi:hypothetical protein